MMNPDNIAEDLREQATRLTNLTEAPITDPATLADQLGAVQAALGALRGSLS